MSRAVIHLLVVMAFAGAACRQAPAEEPAAVQPTSTAADEIAALKADVEMLKGKAPSASVAMADVGFHFANLWFAGQAGNWPLANYYFSEGRNHIRWLIRIVPNPKGPDGNPVDVKGIFDGLDTSTFADLKKVIDEKDAKKFPEAYRTTLESCYQCHKAVGRPYLRLMVPKTVPQPIINLDPVATWPQ